MRVFTNWIDARVEAETLAQQCKRDVGVESAREFGKQVYRVFLLPEASKRYGYELRCEVVSYTAC